MLTQSTRPKCKADTYYVPMSDGVYLRGNTNHLILKGKSLYSLLEHLIPNLDGNATLEEITGGLDESRRHMITNLIEKLFAHQFLYDTSQDQSHTLGPLELETYASDIAFIESFQTSAAYRFEHFCNKHLLLIGSGRGLTSLVQASLQCGVKKISMIVTAEGEADSRFRQDVLDLCATNASKEDAHLLDAPSWDNEAEVRDTIQNYDAILHIAEHPMLARAQLLNRLCIEQQKTFIQAIIVDDHAWVGPLVCPETDRCWECAWRRMQANLMNFSDQLSHYEFRDQPLNFSSRPLAESGAAIIANRLIFEVFQYFTQTDFTETSGTLSIIDLATFLSESHAFLPHPHCLADQHPVAQTASEFLAHIQQLQQQSSIDPDIFLENIATCIDERLGLFTTFDTSNFVQAPLAVYRACLSKPMANEHQAESLNVIAVNVNARDARMRIAQQACERYAANFVNERRLHSPVSVSSNGATSQRVWNAYALMNGTEESRRGPATLQLEKEPFPSKDEWRTWALDLQTQQASLVPATRVFSSPGQQERGIASGKSWEEALCLALLDWCNYLTVEQLKDAQQACLQVDLERTPMTSEGVHLRRLLKAAGREIAIYDVTGILQVPTFATCLDKKTIAYSTHCDGAQALSAGLEQALRQYQSEQFQQPDYAVTPVPDLPANLRSDQLSVPGYTAPEGWSARREWLLQQLRANGSHAFAVPLDHDPVLARALPFIVRVLLNGNEFTEGE